MVEFPASSDRRKRHRPNRILVDGRKTKWFNTSRRISTNRTPTLAAKTKTRRGWGHPSQQGYEERYG